MEILTSLYKIKKDFFQRGVVTSGEILQNRRQYEQEYRDTEGDRPKQLLVLRQMQELKEICKQSGHSGMGRPIATALALACPNCGYARFDDTPPK